MSDELRMVEPEEAEPADESLIPHLKPHLTSPFGRLVERISYLDAILISGLVLLLSSLWFWLGPDGQTLRELGNPVESWASCAYFALVTFTSLGYGDIAPHGFGRVVAILDVLTGLAMTALFIGKVASERQSSLLLLLHTSDTQRRIARFGRELESARIKIRALQEQRDADSLRRALDSHHRLSKALGNYLMFNAHQAGVVEFGNFTALTGLYDEIRDSFAVLQQLHRDPAGDAVVMGRALSNMKKLSAVTRRMKALHGNRKDRDPLWKSVGRRLRLIAPPRPSTAEQTALNRLQALVGDMTTKIAEAEKWVREGHHPIQMERVFDASPATPMSEWPTGMHKAIALRLKISNSVASKCISDLLATGRLPKQRRQTDQRAAILDVRARDLGLAGLAKGLLRWLLKK